ncbi:MAG: adenylate/guanylate cyclase domain-containing protein, partial [Armatimonadota bacterium]|nr:adenylate/guanylate cyclase domain-containing protein [Armatimonadota bacterium]
MPVDLPSGVVTLVFTDIEGSSSLWEVHRNAFQVVLEEHNRLLRAMAVRWNGIEVKTEGDAFFLAFAKASDAVQFAVEGQREIASCAWSVHLPGLAELRVRIGMHTGEPIVGAHPDGAQDYFGPMVNRAARVGAAGHGGQIILSGATHTLAVPELPATIAFQSLGMHRLKGVGEEHLWQALHADLSTQFAPLKTMQAPLHNLPLPSTALIGREKEVAAWHSLRSELNTRLLTLLGFGGLGKTRLALELAELSVGDFAHGVW